jgi:ubiquinone/menaquinone biosynthesis C-methylase UbiE
MSLDDLAPTARFSDRVNDYVQYRPSYPPALLDHLGHRVGGFKNRMIADVGSGTGIFTKLLLNREAKVHAIEPNKEMRDASDEELNGTPGYRSHGGTAEKTGLPDHVIDLITCAQAFHWFDPVKTRVEFNRILKPGGKVALIWNDVDQESDMGKAYENFKAKYSDETFQKIRKIESSLEKTMPEFFGKVFESKVFPNYQDLDEKGLLGRYFSSSYAPKDDLRKESATAALREIYFHFQSNGLVRLPYKTELFFG